MHKYDQLTCKLFDGVMYSRQDITVFSNDKGKEELYYRQKSAKTDTIFIRHTDMDNENIQLGADHIEFSNLLQNLLCFGERQSLTISEYGCDTIETLIHW